MPDRQIIQGRTIGCSQRLPLRPFAFPFTFKEPDMPDDLTDRHLGEDATVTVPIDILGVVVSRSTPEIAVALGTGATPQLDADPPSVETRLRPALDAWMSDDDPDAPPEVSLFAGLLQDACVAAGFHGIVDAYHRCGPGVLTSEDGTVGRRVR